MIILCPVEDVLCGYYHGVVPAREREYSMKYFISKNSNPLIYVSSGKFVKNKRFIHEKRNIDTFVIFICLHGSIYIRQDGIRYILKPNQYLLLFSDHEHMGYKESDAPVSYYWCHFKVMNNAYQIINKQELSNLFIHDISASCFFILPEYGDLSDNVRAIQIFHQLLDISRERVYSDNLPNYALSLLVMEVSQEFIEQNFISGANGKINSKMEKIIEWIRVNYSHSLSLDIIGKRFNYNRDYLSAVFKKYKGLPLMRYILIFRLSMAKKLLLNTMDTVKEVAWKVGFKDERVFMKQFKKMEDTTPTKYRNAFSRVKLVK
jgi:AraC-like DNA-binding protein